MRIIYTPQGVCAKEFVLVVDEGRIQEVHIEGGCNGNLQAISALLSGMEVEQAIRRLEGIRCGERTTSCPDQLAQALKQQS